MIFQNKLAHRATGTVASVITLAFLLGGCAGGSAGSSTATYPSKTVEIMVPAAAGGGWDSTGRAVQKVMESENISEKAVEVFNVEGGGGATGLSQLQGDKGDPHKLMMTGLVMIGSLKKANSPVKLTDSTPIATLTAEAEAFVVPADSKFKSIGDVVEAFKADPASVTFGGGSAGGSDHLVVGQLIKEAGGKPADIKYVGYSGGGEATAGILSGDVAVGVSGISEFEGQIASGDMRLLAISSAAKREVAGSPAPTLKEAGFDIDFNNWRAIVAAPGISDEEAKAVAGMIDEVHSSQAWTDVREKNGWTDFYRTGEDAKKFIADETTRVAGLLHELGL
jgi:putative tricarboxylic transport membrane protein